MSRDDTDKKSPAQRADARLKAAMTKLEGQAAPEALVDHARKLSGMEKPQGDRRS